VGGPPPIKGYRERVREWIQERKEKRSRDRQKKPLGPGVAKVPKVHNLVGEHLQRQLTYLKRKTKPLYAHPQAQAPLAGHNNNNNNNFISKCFTTVYNLILNSNRSGLYVSTPSATYIQLTISNSYYK